MVHERQRLPLGLEAGDHLAAVHAGLDDFQRHLAADGMLLLGDEDQSHAALADLLHQLVGTDHRAGTFGHEFIGCDCRSGDGRFQKASGFFMGGQQVLHAVAQGLIAAAFALHVGAPLLGGQLDGGNEDFARFVWGFAHDAPTY